jgi:hypothetical protein
MASSALGIRWRSFQVPRRDHRLEECEDAFAVAPDCRRIAISDGAAESAWSGLWARLLVQEFVHGDHRHHDWPDWIAPLQKHWADAVRLPLGADPLPWYLEERYDQGAFATFLGMSIHEGRWQALAVGDTCLFQLRKDQIHEAFPLTHSSQFSNSPWLVGSRTSPEEVPRHRGVQRFGEWRPGDRLLLMTDALSKWFLTATEAGGRPWPLLEGLLDQTDEWFTAQVEQLRSSRNLRNDDTTLVVVSFAE